MNETQGCAEYIYTTLKASGSVTGYVGGSAAARIYEDIAPKGAVCPHIIFGLMSTVDQNTVGGRGISDNVWLVKAVVQSPSYRAAATISAAIDRALDRSKGTATISGVETACVRVQEVRYSEEPDGVPYRHLGATYRIFAAGTA